MRSVEGEYCSRVQQTCLRQKSDHEGHPTQSERCLEYQEPSICTGERQPLRFCIDRFEWPNRVGEMPRVLVSWSDASALCRDAGKRLCEEKEWTLACEGEQALPYTLGYSRPAQACAIDQPYRAPPRARLLPYDQCREQTGCREELARLDQRRPARDDSACVSPFGAVDMNGNVNEWVDASPARYPYRGALKGGWWGPVRNRCRPAVRQHREDHWGYEIGFRCCRNAVDTPLTPP
jgi:formylglycine-generating enzyme required for sulfatase activity